ncbi:MAG: hypothetical protein Q9157_002789, partial [Trypethelium eluteriae]
ARDWIAIHQHIIARHDRMSMVKWNGNPIPDKRVKKEIARNLKRHQTTDLLCDKIVGLETPLYFS